MNSFIFPTELKTQLQFLIDNPLKLGGTLAFHGSYGIGKSSFATYLGNLLAKEVIHYDCAKTKSSALEDIELRNRTTSLACLWDTEDQTEKVFERCYILDEFNELPNRSKSSYKIPLENLAADSRCLVIIIANTNEKNTLSKALTPAIASRCYSINFDIQKQQQYEEVTAILHARYPLLSDEYIRDTLPDLRQVVKRAKLLSN